MRQFEGVLAYVDCASDRATSGAHGHRVVVTKQAGMDALSSLVGKPINCAIDLARHSGDNVVGLIKGARIDRKNRVRVWGLVDPTKLHSRRGLGMSFEASNCHISDVRTKIWEINRLTFSGAAVLYKTKAAYQGTSFRIKRGIECLLTL